MPLDERIDQAGDTPILTAAALALSDRGAAIVTATRDASLHPRIARAWGPELLGSNGGLRLCVETGRNRPAEPGSVSAPAPIAVAFTLPGGGRGLQAKGVIDDVAAPDSEQLRRVDEHWGAYREQATLAGISARLIDRLIDRDGLVSVTITIDELHEQPPRLRAGARP